MLEAPFLNAVPGSQSLRTRVKYCPLDLDGDAYERLEKRIGPAHLRARLGLEAEYETHVFRRGTHFPHIENLRSAQTLIRVGLKLTGLYWRARRNACAIRVVHNDLRLANLPRALDGFTILHLSDIHADLSETILHALIERVRELNYDLCVLTGDYRAATFGPWEAAVAGMERLRVHLRESVYAVLGNHDSIRMVPRMEAAGMRMLLNESAVIQRNGTTLYLAGIDDAHYYQVDNLQRAHQDIPANAVSILLSHTPEPYRHAAHAGFSAMLCGHTHGGQLCLPGGIPILTDCDCPRRVARGAWRQNDMIGYTSVGAGSSIVDVRLNCPPEITLHTLRAA